MARAFATGTGHRDIQIGNEIISWSAYQGTQFPATSLPQLGQVRGQNLPLHGYREDSSRSLDPGQVTIITCNQHSGAGLQLMEKITLS